MARALQVNEGRADDAFGIDAPMGVEILVFGRYERLLDQRRNFVRRQIEPSLSRIFSEQAAVSRVHARHDRRLIVLELRVVRQVLLIFPNDAGKDSRRHDEQQRAGSEYEADNANDPAHLDRSLPLRPSASARGVETNFNFSAAKARSLQGRSAALPLAALIRPGIEPGEPVPPCPSRLGRIYDRRPLRRTGHANSPARPLRASVNARAAGQPARLTTQSRARPTERWPASRFQKRMSQWR